MKPTAVFAVAATLLFAGLLAWHFTEDNEVSTEGDSSDARKDAREVHASDNRSQLMEEFSRLKRQIVKMQNGIAANAKRTDAIARRVDMSLPAEGNQSEQLPLSSYENLPENVVDQAITEDLDVLLAGQPIDETWSEQTTNSVIDAASQLQTARLVNAECRHFLCRVEMSHTTMESVQEDLDELTTQPPFNTNGYIRVIASEVPTSIIYFTRNGYELPLPAAQ